MAHVTNSLLLRPANARGGHTSQQSMMEQETEEMLKHADSIRANYGNDVLDLTAVGRYVERLLTNARIRRYLSKHHQETLTTLDQLLAEIAADKQQRNPPSTPNGSAECLELSPDVSRSTAWASKIPGS